MILFTNTSQKLIKLVSEYKYLLSTNYILNANKINTSKTALFF